MEKKESRILDTIFICIIFNIIPIALLGMFKISSSIYTMLYAVFYCIQTTLLSIRLSKYVNHITKKNFLVLVFFFMNNIFALMYSYLNFGNIDSNEFLFIVSSTVNVLLFIFSIEKVKITDNELVSFLKKVCYLGIISVIINVFINYHSILSLRFLSNSYAVSMSSFFPNRNQFGLFMLIEIICLSLLISHKFKKVYVLLFIVFGVNLLLTMSRNSILGLVVYLIMILHYKYVKYRVKMTKNKFLFFVLFLIVAFFISFKIMGNERFLNIINTLFIRMDTLETGSGRFSVWQNGIKIGMNYNILFGVGRYKALELNKLLFSNNLEYFHSMYIEKFASNGLLGIVILVFLLKFVWKKTNLYNNVNYRIIIKSSLISFYLFSIFETTTRFSIGYADTIFLIFFFTFPILISNIKE